jgi:hypothetical protein
VPGPICESTGELDGLLDPSGLTVIECVEGAVTRGALVLEVAAVPEVAAPPFGFSADGISRCESTFCAVAIVAESSKAATLKIERTMGISFEY